MAVKKTFALPKVIDTSSVKSISDELLKYLGKSKDICIDMSDVEYTGTLALQLLVSIEKECEARGGEFTIVNIPACAEDSAKTLGIEKYARK